MEQTNYSTRFVPVRELDEPTRRRMAGMCMQSYEGSGAAVFFGDLASRQEVLLWLSEPGATA